jgi:uncharacterized protein
MEELSPADSQERHCIHCSSVITPTASFCGQCGKQQIVEKKFDDIKGELTALFVYFFLQVIIVLIYTFNESQDKNYQIFLLIVFHSIDLIFGLIYIRSLLPLFKINRRIIQVAAMLIPVAMLGSWLVNWLVDKINYALYHEYYEIEFAFSNLPYHTFFEILEVAFLPAFFEEIAFRGVIYNMSLKFYHNNHLTAILISSALFFIIHLSVISIFWMLPLALLFGFLRKKYNSLIPGMVLHFFFNLTAYAFQEWI